MTLGCWSLAQAQKGNSCRFLESGLWKTLERIWCLERPWVFLDRLYEWISKNHAGKEWEEWGVENRHHRQIQGTPGASGTKGIFAFGERYDLGTSVCVYAYGGILAGTCLPWKFGIRRTWEDICPIIFFKKWKQRDESIKGNVHEEPAWSIWRAEFSSCQQWRQGINQDFLTDKMIFYLQLQGCEATLSYWLTWLPSLPNSFALHFG